MIDPITQYILEQKNNTELVKLSKNTDESIIDQVDLLFKELIEDQDRYSIKYKVERDKWKKGLARELIEDKGDVLAVVIGDKVVAAAYLYKTNLKFFVVGHQYRRKGYGSKLMNFAIQTARKNGVSFVSLGVWEDNEDAKKFYIKHKFKRIALRMKRDI